MPLLWFGILRSVIALLRMDQYHGFRCPKSPDLGIIDLIAQNQGY